MLTPKPKRIQEFKLPTGVLSAALSEDQDCVACACIDGVYLLKLDSGELKKLYQHGSYVSSIEWLSSEVIVSAGYDGDLCWFDVTKQEEIRRVHAHQFWSWDMALSSDRKRIATVTGQYIAGGYKYEPQSEREPSLCILDAISGKKLHELPHVPSVQAVAISPDNRLVSAANLMGEVRVYELGSGELVKQWTTSDFTSWGIIKSHSYLGGVFSMRFTPESDAVLLAGMGPMRDPMAGNGKQLWQKWSLSPESPELLDQTHEGQAGEGLMEALAVEASLPFFVMGGRLRGGDWNAAFFDLASGDRLTTLKTGYRITDARFHRGGDHFLLAGATSQGGLKKQGGFRDYGRVELYETVAEEPKE